MQRPQIVKPIPMESLIHKINKVYFREIYSTSLRLVDPEEALEIALASTVDSSTARKVFVARKRLNHETIST